MADDQKMSDAMVDEAMPVGTEHFQSTDLDDERYVENGQSPGAEALPWSMGDS